MQVDHYCYNILIQLVFYLRYQEQSDILVPIDLIFYNGLGLVPWE